jgi:hypothetical protein
MAGQRQVVVHGGLTRSEWGVVGSVAAAAAASSAPLVGPASALVGALAGLGTGVGLALVRRLSSGEAEQEAV